MTQDQLNHVQSILNDMKFYSIFKRTDAELLRDEGKITWTYERIKKIYEEDYLTLGSVERCAHKYGVDKGVFILWFKRYGFEVNRWSYRKKNVLTEKHLDTLTMCAKDWNTKYLTKSKALYYNYKKVAHKFAREKNL